LHAPTYADHTTPEHARLRLECALVATLSQFDDPDARRRLDALRTHPDPFARQHILGAVVDEAGRRGEDPARALAGFFDDPRAEVRDRALSYALDHPTETFIPLVARHFYAPDDGPDGARLRSTARRYVLAVASQDAACVAPVIAAARDAKCPLPGRIRAIQSLAYPNALPAVLDGLLDALDDAEEALHGYAASSLGQFVDANAVLDALASRLASDRPEETRRAALSAVGLLASRASQRCVPILVEHLDRPGFETVAVTGLQLANATEYAGRLRAMLDALSPD